MNLFLIMLKCRYLSLNCMVKHISKEDADLSVEVCQVDLQVAEALGTAGGNQQHSAGAEVELWGGICAPQEVLSPQLLHTLQPPTGQFNQRTLGEVR